MPGAVDTKRITELFELLPESDRGLILNFVNRLLPDDVATQEDIEDIKQALDEYSKGEFYSLDDLTMD